MHLRAAILTSEVQEPQDIERRGRNHRRRRRARRRTDRTSRQKLFKVQTQIVLLFVVRRVAHIRAQGSPALVKVESLKKNERKITTTTEGKNNFANNVIVRHSRQLRGNKYSYMTKERAVAKQHEKWPEQIYGLNTDATGVIQPKTHHQLKRRTITWHPHGGNSKYCYTA